MKILYVINSPCWTEISPSGLNDQELFNDPLSENFTYFYYNLMKFGLIDKICIFVPDHRWRVGGIVKDVIDTEFGTLKLYKDSEKFKIINSDNNLNYVYCWSKWWECKNIKNKFIIVNPMFNGVSHKNYINKNEHDFALIEGEMFRKFLPKNFPYAVCRLINFDSEKASIVNNEKKIYDWILISSFDPRKRHLEFLNQLIKSKLGNLKGCIIGRDPKNKKKKIIDFFFNSPWRVLKKIKNYQKKINFDLFINLHQSKKIELTKRSKIFVCTSKLDNGPRSQIEAAQLCLPVLSMSHIGASDFINNENKNGEIVKRLDQIPQKLEEMLINIEKYTCVNNKLILSPQKFMPEIISKILKAYNIKKNL